MPSSFLAGFIVFLRAPAASWLAARLLSTPSEDAAAAALLLFALEAAEVDAVEGEFPGELSPSELLKRETMGTKPLLALRRLLIKIAISLTKH